MVSLQSKYFGKTHETLVIYMVVQLIWDLHIFKKSLFRKANNDKNVIFTRKSGGKTR